MGRTLATALAFAFISFETGSVIVARGLPSGEPLARLMTAGGAPPATPCCTDSPALPRLSR